MDSIVNSYPIGSVLLWKTADRLNAERNIGNFRLPQTDEMTPTNYVLDGQQRLTVVYSCLGADEAHGGFKAGYDLVTEEFVEIKNEDLPATVFPLRKISNTTSLLNYRTGLLVHDGSQELQDKLDAVITALTQYKLPVVTLKNLSIDEVCPIFERINSSGTKLSTYDLMVAATWTEGFDLNEKVTVILEAVQPKGFGGMERSTVLKCLSAVKLRSVKDKALKTLREKPTEEIEELVTSAKGALCRAVDLISTSFGIKSWDFLSYEAILIVLTAYFSDRKELLPEEAMRVRQWFWESSFGERYKVGGENFVSNDIETVRRFVSGEAAATAPFGNMLSEEEWATISFRSNVSRSRAFILALAAAGPKNICNGVPIDTDSALSGYNKKEYHHFYPRAFLRSIDESAKANVLANLVMITANSNKIISDTAPSVYVPEVVSELGASRADEVFASNILPLPSEFDYTTRTFAEFLKARARLLAFHTSQLCR